MKKVTKMNIIEKKMSKKVEDLDVDGVTLLLKNWEMTEFLEFVKEKQLNGRNFLNVTEGIIKLWRPRSNAKKLVKFVQELKSNPEKYLNHSNDIINSNKEVNRKILEVKMFETEIVETKVEQNSKITIETIESQYQTVKKAKEGNLASFSNVEELIKKIVPAKSFLYRNHAKKDVTPSYLPMEAGTPKKRKLFRISNYDYPIFDLRRFSKPDVGDRGYYPMKRNSRFFVQKLKLPECNQRPKYKSLSSTEELKYPEDHFYEDLCYNDIEKEARHSVSDESVKPYRFKFHELFQSFKMPFFKRNEEVMQEDKRVEVVTDTNLYENSDGIANMYDSVHVNVQAEEITKPIEKPQLPVEDYLDPVQMNNDYCDVNYRQKEESLLGYIMSIFENRFGLRRETSDTTPSEESDEDRPSDADFRRWSEDKPKTSMVDRPLPVPVENEPYYMDIDRTEAENLLKGQPDGTFVLRPSSQSNHAYTLSVSCSNAVHNVGVRRRPDGRLALGFARRGERSFADVPALLRHHRRRRLLLVANGGVIGATTLNDSPQYYQTPRNIPVKELELREVRSMREDSPSDLHDDAQREASQTLRNGEIIRPTLNESPQYYQTPCNIPVKVK